MLGEATGRTRKEGNRVGGSRSSEKSSWLYVQAYPESNFFSPSPASTQVDATVTCAIASWSSPVSALPCSQLLTAARALHAAPLRSLPRAPSPHGVTGVPSPPVRPTRCPLTSLPSPASLGSLLSYTLPREHAGLLNLLFPTAWNVLPLTSYRSHSKLSPLQTSPIAATSPPFPDALPPHLALFIPLALMPTCYSLIFLLFSFPLFS